MESPLRILHLEDDPKDAELIQAMLETEGIICHVTRVETQADFLVLLEQGGFDLILADHTLPSFDGLSALKITQEKCPDIPFIFVSGTLGEELAIEALKIGATDYVLKERLSRIAPSVQRALREAKEKAERKRAEAELRESEQKYRTLFDSIDEGFCTIEVLFDENEKPVDYRFLQVNPSFERQTGIKNAVGRRMREIAPQHEEHWFEIYGEIALTGEPMRFENEAKELGRWYDVYAFRVEAPKLRRVGILFNDISERKRAEEERQAHLWFLESMDRINRAMQATNDLEQMMSEVLDAVLGIFACDRAWLVYPCDPEAASWRVAMEHTRPEFPGASALGIDLPVDPERADVFRSARASRGSVRFGPGSDRPVPTQLAHRFSIRSQIVMAVYPKADKPYLFGMHQCSYPRAWMAEEERLFEEIGRRLTDALTSLLMFRDLGESERKLEEAQRLTHVGYWDRDLATDLITWSDETYRIFGLPPQARMLNLAQLPELIHPEDQQILVQAVAEALRGGRRYDVEYRVVQPNGEVRLVHSQGDVMRDESGRPRRMFGTVQDITERKRAEQRLVAQHTVTQMLAEATTLEEATPKILQAVCEFLLWDLGVLWSVDRQAGVLRCVEVWHKATVEVPQFEAISRASTFLSGIGLPGHVWSSRAPAYIPDVVHDANFPRASIAAREGLHAAFAFPILLGGDVLGVIEFFSHEIRQPDEDLLNMMTTIGSQIGQFTERKRAEEALHQAQAELAHVTRVATLGELTASIAHEINQPLGAVVNNASACVRWLAAQNLEEARQSAARVVADGHRAGEIIRRIRNLAKKAPPQKDWLDINDTIRDVIALARSEVHAHRVALQTHLAGNVPRVLGDRIQVQQVLLNLLMNAIEAMSGVDEGPRELWISSEPVAATEVVIAVRDSGPGLDPQSLDRLFDAFYTTKPHGLGMGLAISRSIIAAHGGRLWATANAPHGAVFQFTVPSGSEGVA